MLPPAVLALLRVAGAAAILLAVARAGGGLAKVSRADAGRIALYALLGVALNQLLFVEGLSRTTAVNAQVIGTSIPVFTLMFGTVMGLDRVTPRRMLGIVLAAAGALYLVGPDRIGLTPETTVGNAMIATNALFYSLYLVLSKPMVEKYGASTVMAWAFAFGTLMIAPFGMVSYATVGLLGPPTWRVWAAVVYIIIFPTVGSYLLNAWALARSKPSMVAVYIYLQPVLTGLLAMVLLDEKLDKRALPAAALIFTGVALSTWASRDPSSNIDDTLGGR